MIKLWSNGTLQQHIVVSGEEFIVGFVIASIAGIVIGLFTATFDRVSLVLTPWISGLYATPIIAVAPLLILWFGVGIWSKIAVVISLVDLPDDHQYGGGDPAYRRAVDRGGPLVQCDAVADLYQGDVAERPALDPCGVAAGRRPRTDRRRRRASSPARARG